MKTRFFILLSIFMLNCKDVSERIFKENLNFYKSGFYFDKTSGKYFYKYKYYGTNEESNEKKIISVPVLNVYGDTLKEIDIATFKSINNFYVDKNYVFKFISQADYFKVIAEPLKNIISGCYYEKSYYVNYNDSIFYESSEGKACNGFLFLINKDTMLNYKNNFNVLDIENFEEDCAILGTSLVVNGCLIKSIEDLELSIDQKNRINSAIKFKKFKKAHCY